MQDTAGQRLKAVMQARQMTNLALSQKLGDGGEADGIRRGQLPGLPGRQAAVDRGGNEGHIVAVYAGEIFVVQPPEGGVSEPLHGGEIYPHQTSR